MNEESGIRNKELGFLAIACLAFLFLLYPALLHSRQEKRDGIRRDEVSAFKTVLEQEFNKLNKYPVEFDASPHEYVVVESENGGATQWYLRAELENSHEDANGFDLEKNIYYRYITEGGKTYYDVCGGEFECGVSE